MLRIVAFLVASAMVSPVYAQPALESGFAGALRGCEEWVLNPASWVDGTDPFVRAVGLGEQMRSVRTVEGVNLPPAQMQVANHYWRINSTPRAGYFLVVSDQVPMCHITGGGDTDLQPAIIAVTSSAEFAAHWEQVETSVRGDMVSSLYRNRREPKLSMVVSRASGPGQRLDRVQVIATATYQIEN